MLNPGRYHLLHLVPDVDADGQHEVPRRRRYRTARRLRPVPPVRGEDLEMITAPLWPNRSRFEDADTGMTQRLDLYGEGRLAQLTGSPSGEAGDVVGKIHRLGANRGRRRHRFRHGVAGSQHQIGSQLAQLLAQIGQRFPQKGAPVGRAVTGVEDARIDHEQGHDAVASAGRSGQGGVVAQAQGPTEQHDDGGHQRRS